MIEIDNLKVNYNIIGQGKPLLVLHGWRSRLERWDKVAEILSKNGIQVILIDFPGFGESEIPKTPWDLDKYCSFIEKFADKIGLQSFYILGHSFGGGVAIKYALRNPKRIERMFLVASAVLRRKTLKKRAVLLISRAFRIFSFLPFYNLTRRAFYKYVIKSDYILEEGVMKETYLNIIREDLFNDLSLILASTVLIWGEKDAVTTLKEAYIINRQIKYSKLEIIKGGGHDLEKSDPRSLSQKILENL